MLALGHEKRLTIYRLLVKAGFGGMNVGALQKELGIAPSTLSHHVAWLARAGLIKQERRGREIVCRADFVLMRRMVAFLTDECCAGVGLDACLPEEAAEKTAGGAKGAADAA